MKEALRDLYRLDDPAQTPGLLDRWIAWACRSRIPAFVRLSRTVRKERDRILAAVEHGLSNSRLESLNSKVRLINHRGYGHHSPAPLIAMIYLTCDGIAAGAIRATASLCGPRVRRHRRGASSRKATGCLAKAPSPSLVSCSRRLAPTDRPPLCNGYARL